MLVTGVLIACAALALAFLALTLVYSRWPQYLLPALIVVGVLSSRPTAVGERYPALGPSILLACGAFSLVTGKPRQPRFPVFPSILLLAAWLALWLHGALAPGSEPHLLSLGLTMIAPALAFAATTRDRELLTRTSALLVGAVIAASALSVAATILGLGLGWGNTKMMNLPVGYTRVDSGLFLPGALSYGTSIGDGIPRFLGVGREPGMGAIFIGWAFFSIPTTWRRRTALKALLIGGLVLTQSTAGLGLFAICWGLFHVLGRNQFRPIPATLALLSATWLAWLAVYNTDFGLVAKVDAGESFSSRMLATQTGLEAVVNAPFTATTDIPLSSVNLIASAAAHGALWLLFAALLLTLPVIRGGHRSRSSYGALVILATMLTSQPLVGSTAIVLLSLICYQTANLATRPEDLQAGAQATRGRPGPDSARRSAETPSRAPNSTAQKRTQSAKGVR